MRKTLVIKKYSNSVDQTKELFLDLTMIDEQTETGAVMKEDSMLDNLSSGDLIDLDNEDNNLLSTTSELDALNTLELTETSLNDLDDLEFLLQQLPEEKAALNVSTPNLYATSTIELNGSFLEEEPLNNLVNELEVLAEQSSDQRDVRSFLDDDHADTTEEADTFVLENDSEELGVDSIAQSSDEKASLTQEATDLTIDMETVERKKTLEDITYDEELKSFEAELEKIIAGELQPEALYSEEKFNGDIEKILNLDMITADDLVTGANPVQGLLTTDELLLYDDSFAENDLNLQVEPPNIIEPETNRLLKTNDMEAELEKFDSSLESITHVFESSLLGRTSELENIQETLASLDAAAEDQIVESQTPSIFTTDTLLHDDNDIHQEQYEQQEVENTDINLIEEKNEAIHDTELEIEEQSYHDDMPVNNDKNESIDILNEKQIQEDRETNEVLADDLSVFEEEKNDDWELTINKNDVDTDKEPTDNVLPNISFDFSNFTPETLDFNVEKVEKEVPINDIEEDEALHLDVENNKVTHSHLESEVEINLSDQAMSEKKEAIEHTINLSPLESSINDITIPDLKINVNTEENKFTTMPILVDDLDVLSSPDLDINRIDIPNLLHDGK